MGLKIKRNTEGVSALQCRNFLAAFFGEICEICEISGVLSEIFAERLVMRRNGSEKDRQSFRRNFRQGCRFAEWGVWA